MTEKIAETRSLMSATDQAREEGRKKKMEKMIMVKKKIICFFVLFKCFTCHNCSTAADNKDISSPANI